MKILVIFIAGAVAAGASRPPPDYNSDYYDSSPYFGPSPSSVPRSSLFSTSYLKQKPFFKNPQSIMVKDDILKYGPPPDFQEERNFFDFPPSETPYLLFSKPHSHYQGRLSSFREDQFNAQDYKGPPPPLPEKDFRKQILHMQDERIFNSSQVQIIKEYTNQQPTITEHHQPLSSNGHEHQIGYGNQGLGFASVVSVTSPDINPLSGVDITSTTTELSSAITMQSPTTNEVQISQKQKQHHPDSNALNSKSSISDGPTTPTSKNTDGFFYTQSSTNLQSTSNDPVLTTPATTKMSSVMPQSNLTSEEKLSTNIPETIITLPKLQKSSYDFRTMREEFPNLIHEQMPTESLEQKIHIPQINQNFLFYETKHNLPIHPSRLEIHEKNQNNDNITPLKLNIPTTSTFGSLSQSTTPMKSVYQNVGFSRTAVPLVSGPNENTYIPEQNQLHISQFGKLKPENNLGSSLLPYYFLQKNDYLKPSTQINANIPLGSFYMLPNNVYSKQATESNFRIPLAGNFEVKQYLHSTSNSVPSTSTVEGIEKLGLSFQQPHRLPEPIYAKLGFDQSPW